MGFFRVGNSDRHWNTWLAKFPGGTLQRADLIAGAGISVKVSNCQQFPESSI